jgi:hypothetical protein
MWNDTEIPLAIFFTFRCYDTWLHGDERGAVDRTIKSTEATNVRYNIWQKFNEKQMSMLIGIDPSTLGKWQCGNKMIASETVELIK